MSNPLTTSRNNYHENIKNSTIFTPPGVAKYIFDKAVGPLYNYIREENKVFYVSDLGIGTGNLVKPLLPYHKDKKVIIFGYDIVDYRPKPCDIFYQKNFMAVEEIKQPVNLFITNPPFNNDGCKKIKLKEILKKDFSYLLCKKCDNNEYCNKYYLHRNKMGKALLPEVFADKMFKLRPGVPAIMITPMGFVFNQRRKSSRWKKYSLDKVNTISSTLMLPLDAFPDVEFHCCVLCFNFPEGLLPPFQWFERKYL